MENSIYENDLTDILDTIPRLFRSKSQILSAIDFLQKTDNRQREIIKNENTGDLSKEQYSYLEGLIAFGDKGIAIASLHDTLDGLNML